MSIIHTRKAFWQKVLQWFLVLFITLSLGELFARFYGEPKQLSWMLEQNMKTVDFVGLSELNEAIEFDPFLFWRLKKDLKRFHIKGHVFGKQLCFSVTTNNHLRSPASSPDKEGKIVLALGDSCTFGLGVNDGDSWPAQLQLLLNQQGVKATVVNAGVPGYSAFQGKRFLEKNRENLNPDLVIACFGFGDHEYWDGLSDIEVARRMDIAQQEPLLKDSRLYYLSRQAFQNVLYAIRHYLKGNNPGYRLSGTEYQETIKEMKRLCDQKNIGFIYIIWPYQIQIANRLNRFLSYQTNTTRICAQEHIDCVNLITPFIDANLPLYIDHIHANEEGCRLTAEVILPHAVSRLKQAKK